MKNNKKNNKNISFRKRGRGKAALEEGDCISAAVGDREAVAPKGGYLKEAASVGRDCRAGDHRETASFRGDCRSAACDPLHGRADTRTEGGDREAAASKGGDILGAYKHIHENFCKIFTKQFSEIFTKNVKDEIVLNFSSITAVEQPPSSNCTIREPKKVDAATCFIEKFTKKFIKKFSVKLSKQFVKKFIKKYSSIRKS